MIIGQASYQRRDMLEVDRLPTRQAREEEMISQKLSNDAARLARLCSSRVLDGLPLAQKMTAMQEVQDGITNLYNLWVKGES